MKKLSIKKIATSSNVKLMFLAVSIGLVAFGTMYVLGRKQPQNSVVTAKCDTGVVCVSLKNDHAEPDAITVPLGGYAQFNSADGKVHNIGMGEGDAHHDGEHIHEGKYASGDFKADEAWKVQFNEAGTFQFHDHYRPKISFTVIVYKPGGDYKIK